MYVIQCLALQNILQLCFSKFLNQIVVFICNNIWNKLYLFDKELKDYKTRKVVSLLQTAKVLDKMDMGMSITMGRQHHGVNKNEPYLQLV